jgi:toxin HigB-1
MVSLLTLILAPPHWKAKTYTGTGYDIIALDDIIVLRYHEALMIRHFRDREAERIFHRERSSRLPPDIQCIAQRKLAMLDAAASLQDLRAPPGNRLERLSGTRAGQYSIRINGQWRICFHWIERDAYDVEITHYH